MLVMAARRLFVVPVAEGCRGARPPGQLVEPYGPPDELGRFPFVAGPNVGVNEGIRVAQVVDVHAAEGGVCLTACLFDRSGEQVGICEELDAVLAGHLGEGCRVGVFAEQYAVSGEELDVTNHGVATWEFGENGGVLSSCCGADAVVAPIHGCDAIGAHAAMACGAHRRGALAELGE